MSKVYFITICKAQKREHVTQTDIEDVLYYVRDALEQTGHIYRYIYGRSEKHGIYKQLHHHALIMVKGRFIYSDYTKINGFRIYYERVRNYKRKGAIEAYIRYINKNYREIAPIPEIKLNGNVTQTDYT